MDWLVSPTFFFVPQGPGVAVRDDAFAHIGLGCLFIRKAAREVFDVILIFTRVMRMAAETKIISVLILERFDARLLAKFPRVTQIVVVALARTVRAAQGAAHVAIAFERNHRTVVSAADARGNSIFGFENKLKRVVIF